MEAAERGVKPPRPETEVTMQTQTPETSQAAGRETGRGWLRRIVVPVTAILAALALGYSVPESSGTQLAQVPHHWRMLGSLMLWAFGTGYAIGDLRHNEQAMPRREMTVANTGGQTMNRKTLIALMVAVGISGLLAGCEEDIGSQISRTVRPGQKLDAQWYNLQCEYADKEKCIWVSGADYAFRNWYITTDTSNIVQKVECR